MIRMNSTPRKRLKKLGDRFYSNCRLGVRRNCKFWPTKLCFGTPSIWLTRLLKTLKSSVHLIISSKNWGLLIIVNTCPNSFMVMSITINNFGWMICTVNKKYQNNNSNMILSVKSSCNNRIVCPTPDDLNLRYIKI